MADNNLNAGSSGGSSGPATDKENEPVGDPTFNVLQLVNAAIQRQDDLRTSEARHIKEMLDLRAASHYELRNAEEARIDAILTANVKAAENETRLREAHRLELKADNEKALTTALTAAEKAVQAALAAAEKARDQQTIASQLATTKAENAFVEQLSQQGETFKLAIANLVTGLNDQKQLTAELRAEKRGGNDEVSDKRAGASVLMSAAGVFLTLVTIVVIIIANILTSR